ncbi:protein neprosin-like [Tasmannia lanceolata]|uniref:protein neprosin-like n=1 Tax=Tasmannia lanceolata TaxID=3420 RepID=UPI0040644C92
MYIYFLFAVQSTLTDQGRQYGSRAALNLWEPKIIGNQNSASFTIVRDASPLDQIHSIQVGWMVNNALYHDFHPHLSTAWTNDNYGKTGCNDVVCPGFVQVSRDTPLGVRLSPSSDYNGTQHYIIVTVYKDPVNKDWWLLYGDDNQKVGYWPKALFNSTFADYADVLQWGGIVYNDGVLPWPEMGSGHKPDIDQEYRKSCYIGGMNFIDINGDSHAVSDALPRVMVRTSPSCYDIWFATSEVPGEDYAILFGGAGGNNC